MAVPKRVADRIKTEIRKYSSILKAQLDRDVSEADTVTIVKDLLGDVFGFDKYAELTGEHAIRGTYCDLAIKIDGRLRMLIEVKAIGITLNDRHTKQAIDYAANQGVDWVMLTNGIHWHLYHVLFKKPIDKEEILHINLLEVNTRSNDDIEKLYLLTREAAKKSALRQFRTKQTATSRFVLAAILMNSDVVLSAIRREVRRVNDVLVDKEDVIKTLRAEVIKREALEGEQAEKAARAVSRKATKKKASRSKSAADASTDLAS